MKKRILSILLVLIMLVGMLPLQAFATESDSAGDAVVYVSGAKNGTLCLVNQPVTVTDLNADGLLSYDEALKAAHDKYCPDGYVSIEGSYGLQVGMLWGEGDGYFANALFYANDEALQMNVGESYVSDGDRLYACMLKYSDGWNDVYAYFDNTAITVDTGEEFTLTLNGSSYFGSPIAYDQIQIGTWSDGSFTALSGKSFDENGQITLSFEQAGTYIVSAEGEYYDDYGSLSPIIPPYCVVTVNAPASAPAKPVLNFMVNKSSNAANSDPQKAVLGDDGILRIENRSPVPTYLWVGSEDGATVGELTFLQGLEASNVTSENKRTSKNEYDGTTYQSYYYSSKYKLPIVAKTTVTAADGVTTADYYIIVSEGTAGQYVTQISGFTADNSSYDPAAGISFYDANSAVTLTPVTDSIGTGQAQDITWKWSTSDPSVAVVDQNGKVTSIGGGSATITASYQRISHSCTVTSTAPEHNVHTYESDVCSVCGTKKPAARSATFTLVDQNGSFAVAKDGQTELYRVQMSVSDADCDGEITVHDAFLEAHKAYSTNGTADFATVNSSYGPYIVKLWGIDTSSIGYFQNDAYVSSITEELKKDDNLTVFFYRDTKNWSDLYTYFSVDSHKAVVGQTSTFTLNGIDGKIPAGASVKVIGSDGNVISDLTATVGSDGSFSVTFPSAGSYTLEAGGTTNTAAPVVPDRTQVTVYEKAEKTVYVTLSDGTGKFVTGKNGDELYRIAVKTQDDPADPDGMVTLREVLVELHRLHHADGADAVAATDSALTKLWGVSGYGFGYCLNDIFLVGSGTKTGTNDRSFQDELLGTVVEDNDYLNVWILQDTSYNFSDTYTYFDPAEVSCQAGQTDFTAYGSNMWNPDGTVPAGAAVKVFDSENVEQTALNTTVDDDGKFSITFPAAGSYRVELHTNGDKYFVPSRCMVTVTAESDSGGTIKVSSAEELPTEIPEGTVYELTADITLTSGQQISKLAGVLDGKGHTITLADKPLAAEVSGTIQNLGVLSSGTLSLSGYSGSMAVTLSGTIQNCYSMVNMTTSGWDDIGGLVGTISGGKIYNSYYAGTNSAMFADGLVAMGGDNSEIANSLYTAGYSAIGMNSSKVTQTSVVKKTAAEMKESDAVAALNTDIKDTGFQWVMDTANTNNGFPVLKAVSSSDPVDKTALAAKIADVEAMDESLYTETTWAAVETALTEAKAVNENEAATQSQVNTALSDLEKAVNGLEKKKPLVPVAPPADTDTIVHITSQADLAAITPSDATKYYVLDNDITLSGGYSGWWSFDTFQGVLDGQGHTITFNGTKSGLFYNIGKNGVVQNVHFAGSIDADHGACGLEIQGAVINSYSEVSGSNASGFAKRLNGGVLSNCYSISTAGAGAIIAQTSTASGTVYTGTMHNVYWDNSLAQPVSLSALTVSGSTGALSMKTMKTLDFVAILNENRGTYGTKWGQSSTGYPYFGEDQEYDPDPEIVLPEDSTKLTFQAYNANESAAVENQQITLDVNAVDGFGVAGTFSLPDYSVPEGASVKWSCSQQTPAETGAINESDGEFFLYKEGVLAVTATLVKADGSTEVLASAKVNAVSYEIEDIKVYLTGIQGDTENATEVVNGAATVQGSESQWIIVKAKYEGESIYREVSIKSFSFAFAENDIVHHLTDASVFYFEAPGTAALTVTYNQNTAISETVQITSAYVPVTSVKPAASGTYTVHDRNANSDSSGEFLDLMLSHGVGNVIVEPANASYAANWTLTSSNPEIAEYVDAYLKALLPKKAGAVTLTATIIDKGPEGTGNTEVTGSSTITIEYFNPVSSVTVDTSTALTVKENERIDLPITFTGPENINGYHVTEADMTWNFTGEGEVEITRNGNEGVLIYGEDSKEYCVSNDKYQITGIKAGTVTVTGTPIDQTGGAQAITFTVEVTSGTPETPADNDKLVSEGIQNAQNYLRADTQYEYGDEWVVFALTRSGKTLSEETVDHYLSTVAEAYKAPGNAELKPTTIARVILAVSVLGEDASNFEGLDLVEMLCTSDGISAGSNESIWALIALDSMDYEVPDGAAWSRETLIAEVLKYQNESTGAFGLTNNTSASLDMTAMAIQALAPYYSSNAEVKTAVDAALAWLQGQMDRNCDFGSSEATAQVMIALTALQLDPLDEDNGFAKSVARNLITALDSYAFVDGGYKHFLADEKSNSMATQQVLLALEAYRRFTANEDRLYDLNGNGEIKYAITVADSQNGSVRVSKEKAAQGETISITVTPAVGYELDALQVTDASGKTVPVSDDQFVMPVSDVTVTATFKQAPNAVQAVEDAIASMKVEKADQKTLEAVQAIQSAYDALTEQEKAQVSNAADLEKLWDAFDAALDAYVKEKTDALNDYIEDLGKSNYTAEKWSEIETIQADTIAEFAKANTAEAADKLYADAILGLQNVSYGNTITVSFTLLGDSEHGDNGTVHTLADGNLTTWIGKTSYQLEAPATVLDVFELAVAGKYSYVNSGNYISSVGGLSEFDNGTNSGWKYTLNGVYPSLGVEQQELKNGDVIIFHYTDDYTKEDGSTGTEEDSAVQKVEKLIDDIGTVTLDKADEIAAARKAYDNLTYTQKKLVDNYATLTAAESKYAQLKAADDEKKAGTVEDLIDAIKEGSTTFEDDVKAAQKAYNNLTADQKKLVDNYYKLANYLKDLADEEDKEAAEAVEKLIEALDTITLDSEEDIKAARVAYDKLTDEQKALVENLAVLEAAEERLAELKALADVADIYKTTGDYLENLGAPIPGSVGGEWMVIGLARSDREIKGVDAYYEAVIQYVQENIDESARMHSAKSSENSRMILALTAIGKDVTDVGGHNLLTGLNSMEFIQKQGINGPIWALLAFDSGNYPVPEGDVSREALIQVLLDAQLADGGWALSGDTSDADITGMALQALAPYYKTNAEVKAAIDEALITLSEMQAADGSYASIDGTSSESIAQVIVALSALGIDADTDARFIKNGVSVLDALCAFYVEGGGFRHIPEGSLDGMATEQGYYALVAYFRMLDDETALYNMTDVIDKGGDVEAEPDETMPAETEPVETEPTPTDESKGSFPWWIIIALLVAGVAVVLVLNRKKIFTNVR